MNTPAASRRSEVLPSAIGQALALAERWEERPGERRMVAALLRWLVSARWIGSASRAAFEVPWRGRRIDLVTMTGRGQLSAFEFKLGGTRRVFEQAMYNSISAHRSWVVSGSRPSVEYLDLAREQGLGIFVVNGSVELVQRPLQRVPPPTLSRRLLEQARVRSVHHV
jgi:hypothetical protein